VPGDALAAIKGIALAELRGGQLVVRAAAGECPVSGGDGHDRFDPTEPQSEADLVSEPR